MFNRARQAPWAALAVLALVAAFGGTAVAGQTVTAAKKKSKHTDSKADTKLFDKLLAKAAPTLSVAKAGHAGSADSATTATNATHAGAADDATRVGGQLIKRVFYAANSGSGPQQVLSLDGLTLTASCSSGGGDITVTAGTTVAGTLIHAGGDFLSGGTPTGTPLYAENDHFNVGDTLDLTDAGGAAGDSVQGTLTYARPDGVVVTATYSEEEGTDVLGTGHSCVFLANVIGS
jgi:hypothetical protein